MTYREGAEEERSRCIPFGSLSGGSKMRLQAFLRNRNAVLMEDQERLPASYWVWVLLGGVGLGLAAFAQFYRFGDLSVSPRSPILGSLIAGVGLAAALGGLPLGWVLWRINRLPRGVFLLPFDLIDTRSDTIWIHPLSWLERAYQASDGRIRLQFQGGAVYSLPGPMTGAQLQERIYYVQQQVYQRAARGDEEALCRVDPFWEERGKWPTDTPPQAPPTLPWKVWLGVALVAGFVLGQLLTPLVYQASDRQGLVLAGHEEDDDALLHYIQRGGHAAKEADEIRWWLARKNQEAGGLFRYLRTGGHHRDEADRMLVEQIQAKPSEEKLLRYIESGGREQDWADQMLLQLAIQEGTEAALRAYVARGGKERLEVGQVLLPRLQIDQAVRGRNLPLLRLMASGPEQLPLRQRVNREELSEMMRTEAQKALERLLQQELQRFREQFASAPIATRLLWTLAEKRSNLLLSLPLSMWVTYQAQSGGRRVLHHYRLQEEALPQAVEEGLQEVLPVHLIQVVRRPPSEGHVEVIVDAESMGDAFSSSFDDFAFIGKIRIVVEGQEAEIPFRSICQPFYRSDPLLVLKKAMQAAVLGQTAEGCAAKHSARTNRAAFPLQRFLPRGIRHAPGTKAGSQVKVLGLR
ncbi:MAG: hypothetical protein RMJ98_08070 [Myxococcales bacterium]|nr:hypothetical protein [Polyangiaceae bacterium]MDW8249242.1 hypothetical protein [Myxococcales bacterium]